MDDLCQIDIISFFCINFHYLYVTILPFYNQEVLRFLKELLYISSLFFVPGEHDVIDNRVLLILLELD